MSWNVNGIRSVVQKGFYDFFQRELPDILCLQEVRAEQNQINLDLPGYEHSWNAAEKKGYAGVAVFSRIKPLRVIQGMGRKEHDNEGRILCLEFDKFYLVNVYTPNAGCDLRRLEYRQVWDRDFLKFLKSLEKKKPVIFCGDANVAHQEIDLANPKRNHRNAGFTDEERAGFSNILAAGYIDSFRKFHEDGGHYTWWSYRAGSRARNIGWRIDYVCISSKLRESLKEAFIMPEVMGSDHCPIGIKIDVPS